MPTVSEFTCFAPGKGRRHPEPSLLPMNYAAECQEPEFKQPARTTLVGWAPQKGRAEMPGPSMLACS